MESRRRSAGDARVSDMYEFGEVQSSSSLLSSIARWSLSYDSQRNTSILDGAQARLEAVVDDHHLVLLLVVAYVVHRGCSQMLGNEGMGSKGARKGHPELLCLRRWPKSATVQ